MSADLLTDAAAREEIRLLRDATLFVNAGAGTGKTTALVGRIVELVHQQEPLPGIAAITFTEAAASELRDRLREKFEAEEAVGTVEPGTVEALDEATIATIHGFAQRLLAAEPLAAGIPPGFTVLDEPAAALAFNRRWSQFCSDLEADPAAAVILERAFALGASYTSLSTVARELHTDRHLLEATTCPVPSPRPVDAGPIVRALRHAAAVVSTGGAATDGLCCAIAGTAAEPGFEELAQQLETAGTDADRLSLLVDLTGRKYQRTGNLTNWSSREALAEARGACHAVVHAAEAAVAAACADTIPALTALLSEFVIRSAAERLEHGTLEFHDLLVTARDLLRSSDAVRRRLGTRYRCLLIDEFQDTDPLQIEIAALLTTDIEEAGGLAWHDLPMTPGRLFFVGDEKQAIYRFRKADVRLFHRVRDLPPIVDVALDNNFRSVPAILQWVNRSFATLFGRYKDAGQAAHQALHAARPALPEPMPPVHVLGEVHDGMLVDDLRTVEAHDLATVLREAHDTPWRVAAHEGDVDAPATRPARWADMAVLLPTRASLAHLEAALEHHEVPYRVDSASLVWNSPPVRDVLIVLRAIENPGDSVALVGALRSPLLGCSDEALLEYHRAGGHWNGWPWRRLPKDHALATDHPVVVALDALRRLAERKQATAVGPFVAQVARGLGAFEVAAAHRRPRDHWRRLRFLLEQARLFDQATAGTLAEFLAWTDLQGSDAARTREPVLPEDDDDAVRVLTVHGAKGQEFPICVVSGLNAGQSNNLPRLLWSDDGEPVVSFCRSLADARYEALREQERSFDDQERVRLLYVACTRARDHLVVCLHRTVKDDENALNKPENATLAALLASACESPPDLIETTRANGAEPANRAGPAAGRAPGTPVATLDPTAAAERASTWHAEESAWQAARSALLQENRSQPVVAATTLATRVAKGLPALGDTTSDAAAATEATRLLTDGPPVDGGAPGTAVATTAPPGVGGEADGEERAEREAPPDAPTWRRGRAGTAIGRAVHATLQLADLADAVSVLPIARAQAAAEGIDTFAGHIARLAEAALATTVVQAAVAARHWRELYLAAPVGGILLEGFVDLLYETPEGLVVVDYKTDSVRDAATIDAAVERYRLQVAAYALLVERTTAQPVAGAALLFLTDDAAHPRWIDDLATAMGEVRTALEEAST